MRERVYLDWNATAPLRPQARAAMLSAMDVVGNPSSVHAEGRAVKAVVEKARAQVAAAVGCKPGEVVFTSGATEAAMVLRHVPGVNVEVEPTSHDALWSHQGAGEGARQLYATGLANGETGVILDLPDPQENMLLVDVTQAVGRLPFAFGWSGADFAILSAHKLGGPKGVGALIVREGLDIAALASGGGQEMGRRAGTENVAGIAGFGAAIEAAMRDLEAGVWERVAQLRDNLEEKLSSHAAEAVFVGKDVERLPNTTLVATPGWKGETQVMQMDLAGFAISAGSACSSGKVRESRVLKAMGYDSDIAQSAMRVSLGATTTEAEVMAFADAWINAYEKRRSRAA